MKIKKSELKRIILEELEFYAEHAELKEVSAEADLSPLSSTDHPDFGDDVENDPVKPADWTSTPNKIIDYFRNNPEKWERFRNDYLKMAHGETGSVGGLVREPGWTDAMHQQVIDGMTSTEDLQARIKAIQVALSKRA